MYETLVITVYPVFGDEYCDGGDNDMTSFCLGGVGEVHGAAVVKVKVRHSRSCNRVAPVHTMKYLLPMPVPSC